MSVRVVHCLWQGGIGGAERAVYQLVREQLRGTDVVPAVLFGTAGGTLYEDFRALPIEVVSLDLPNGHAVFRLRRIASRLSPFDLHHFHSAEPLVMLASLLCRDARRVYTHRGGTTSYSLAKRVRFLLTGVLLRRFDALSGNTAHAARCGAVLFRVPRERFEVTYNGVEGGLLEPRRGRDEVRRSLGLADGDYVVGTAANLKPWKRIDLLIEAAAAIDDPRLRVLVVGDGVERGRLEELAERRGPHGRVVFAGVQSAIGDFLAAMDAFCLPSAGLESFGNAAVEAMLTGLPTVVFADGGGLVEHVAAGETGLVVSSRAELEASLRRLLEAPDWGREIGARARERVRERYSPARAAARYDALYRTALAGGSA